MSQKYTRTHTHTHTHHIFSHAITVLLEEYMDKYRGNSTICRYVYITYIPFLLI